MLKLFLWLKYLRRRRIILLSIAAVAMSVSLLIVVASLFTGFIAAFEQSAVEMIGDVMMTAPPGTQFEKYPAADRSTGAVRYRGGGLGHPVVRGPAAPGAGQCPAGERLGDSAGSQGPGDGVQEGPDAPEPGGGRALLRRARCAGRDGGFVGIGVVAQPDEQTDEYDQQAILKEMIGRRVTRDDGHDGLGRGLRSRLPKRRVIPFRVVDLVFSGVYELDSRFVYLPIEALQKELYPGQARRPGDQDQHPAQAGRGSLRGGDEDPRLVGRFRAGRSWAGVRFRIADTDIDTARQLQSQYVAEIKKQMGVLLLIFGVVSFSVVVLVFCIFYMMVKLKQRDVAVIKSCGASSSSVVWLFLGFGVSVGVAGSGIGAVLGYVITRNINAIEKLDSHTLRTEALEEQHLHVRQDSQ